MSANNDPTWMARHVPFAKAVNLGLEKPVDISQAEYHRPMQVRRRQVTLGSKTLTAFSAHDLLESESDHDRSRPGHPFG